MENIVSAAKLNGDENELREAIAPKGGEPLTKIKIWERKLLDFSLRNALLNFRVTKSSLQLMTADPGQLEDMLASGKDFHIIEAPEECDLSPGEGNIYAVEGEEELIRGIAETEFKSNRIRTFLNCHDLDIALKHLYRSAKVSMEENGSNTLFLSLGILRWYEDDRSEKPRYAPIVLIPIDIVRSVRNKGYIIRSRQEDPQINITLLEYLRQEYGIAVTGLDPLPLDEHGINLPLVFETIAKAIGDKNRWSIEEYAFIGLFSFSRFVMWNDLKSRSEELRENKTVSALIDGAADWTSEETGLTPEEIDENPHISDMAVPLSADSSQLSAIAAAARGESFVLHGPPGTGKSQTITNMIANALYNGKSVLFVAEKMAALNVVQKRLEGIGLDPFCLELHSNKTNKTTVLSELNKALEVGRIKSPEEYSAEAKRLKEERDGLNSIVYALHEKRSCGLSLYEAISAYERNISEQGRITFGRNSLRELTRETADRNSSLIHSYSIAISETGNFSDFPLRDIKTRAYSIELRDRFRNTSKELKESAIAAAQAAETLSNTYGYNGTMDKKAVLMLSEISKAMKAEGEVLNGLIEAPHYDIVMEKIKETLSVGKEYSALCENVFEKFEKSVLEYPAAEARMRRKKAESSWFLPKALGLNKLVKELKLYAKNPALINKGSLSEIQDTLCAAGEKREALRSLPSDISALLTGIYMNEQTDWSVLERAVNKTDRVMSAIRIKGDVNPAHISGSLGSSSGETDGSALSSFLEKLSDFEREYSADFSTIDKEALWLTAIEKKLGDCTDNSDKLKYAADFNQAEYELDNAGLRNVSESYRNGKVAADNIEAAYSCGLNYELALMITDNDPRLKAFRSNTYNDLILNFKDTIDKFSHLTMQELAARLSAKIPAPGTESAATSEMGILKRAIKSNGRMMSLRSLFDKIPNLLRRLCPCMLMSPISVAQYIDPSFPKFDLVIFDEASQLPTSEAVGTIARGENVIVVGDPKQLPPTSFFSSNRIDEENSEIEDLESLLDDCLAISMPQQYLKWHYRSRHESLITYSNIKYYDNKLLTFPSPNDLISEVRIIHPEGYYDKGKTKQNKAEARAVVDEIIRRLSDEALRKDSIGVVTFSSVQQNLIDDMLCEEWAKHPELEELDKNSREPVFIKNLENVQGDERDVILFSVGYGPDETGNVSMNFGPLNRDGGWRRLNVAISRARKSMIVYSVLRPEQIDLSRTSSEGVAGLKGFLEFAEGRKPAAAQRKESAACEDDFVAASIASELEKLGYKVKCAVGCSEFKIDIGIINPENEEEYLLGILLDGKSRNSSTARDRFVLQPGVLEGLGWNIVRVWTLDWLDDREQVLRSIKTAIESIPEKAALKAEESKPSPNTPIEFERETAPTLADSASRPYKNTKITPLGSSEEFYLPENKAKICSLAEKIIANEAPISRKLLMKKILGAWSITRGGSRVDIIFADILKTIPKKITADEDRVFIWTKEQDPETYSIYRVEDEDSEQRDIDEIVSEEIRNAVKEVLCQQISLSESDLIKETAKKFGYSRIGGVIEKTIGFAIEKDIQAGRLKKSDKGSISLPG